MYDDMQERLYEVDKSRKNNLVFYGVPQQEVNEDPDQTERLIKNVITVKLQVRTRLKGFSLKAMLKLKAMAQ